MSSYTQMIEKRAYGRITCKIIGSLLFLHMGLAFQPGLAKTEADLTVLGPSNYGVHFVFSVLRNADHILTGTSIALQICNPSITQENAGNFKYYSKDGKVTNYKTFTIKASKCQVEQADTDLFRTLENGFVPNVGEVTTTLPVSMSLVNYGFTKEVSLILPVAFLGVSYKVVTYGIEAGTVVTMRFPSFTVARQVKTVYSRNMVPFTSSLHEPEKSLSVTLQRSYQALQTHNCGHQMMTPEDLDNDYTGTVLTSTKKFAVLSGNCYTRFGAGPFGEGNHFEEMLTPVESWGFKFVVASPVSRVSVSDTIRILPDGTGSLYVTRLDTFEARKTYALNVPRSYIELSMSGNLSAWFMEATMPMMIVILWGINEKENNGGMCLMIPIENWIFYYLISSVQLDYESQHERRELFLSIYGQSYVIDGVRVNGQQVIKLQGRNSSKVSEPAPKAQRWVVSRLVSNLQETLIVTHIHNLRFAVTVNVGWRSGHSYFYPAGLGLRQVQKDKERCMPTQVQELDGIDNDCDGLIDEEIQNLKDEDSDGKVDEDIALACPKGQWSFAADTNACQHVCSPQCAQCHKDNGKCLLCQVGYLLTDGQSHCLEDVPRVENKSSKITEPGSNSLELLRDHINLTKVGPLSVLSALDSSASKSDSVMPDTLLPDWFIYLLTGLLALSLGVILILCFAVGSARRRRVKETMSSTEKEEESQERDAGDSETKTTETTEEEATSSVEET